MKRGVVSLLYTSWRTVGVTGTVDSGMDYNISLTFRGGGTDCSTLHGNQRKSLGCWTEFTQSHLSVQTTTILGRENSEEEKKKKALLITSRPWQKVRKFCDYNYFPGVHTSLCTHMKIWKLWNVKKYVFSVRCESSFWEGNVGQPQAVRLKKKRYNGQSTVKAMSVNGKTHTFAILYLGSLTAAVTAEGNLLLSQTSWPGQ